MVTTSGMHGSSNVKLHTSPSECQQLSALDLMHDWLEMRAWIPVVVATTTPYHPFRCSQLSLNKSLRGILQASQTRITLGGFAEAFEAEVPPNMDALLGIHMQTSAALGPRRYTADSVGTSASLNKSNKVFVVMTYNDSRSTDSGLGFHCTATAWAMLGWARFCPASASTPRFGRRCLYGLLEGFSGVGSSESSAWSPWEKAGCSVD